MFVSRPLTSLAVFNPRRKSLLRGTLLVLGSFALSFRLSDFPSNHATPLLIIPAVLAILGMLETLRCTHPHRDLYYGGVTLLLLMDTMATSLIFFFLFFPYLS